VSALASLPEIVEAIERGDVGVDVVWRLALIEKAS
jgi:hypothetical protein